MNYEEHDNFMLTNTVIIKIKFTTKQYEKFGIIH